MTVMELRCFLAVAKNLSYAKAVKTLYISQPAVSRHIVSLEKDLGVALFIRNRQTVSLTAAGVRFLSEAQDIVERIDLAKYNIQNSIGEESLHIGCVASIRVQGLSDMLRVYHRQCPDVTIHHTEIGALDFHRVSAEGSLDLAFVPGGKSYHNLYANTALSYQSLYRGRICCVVRRDHPLAGKALVSLEELSGETLILADHEHCPPEMDDIQHLIRLNGRNLKYYFSGSVSYTIPMIDAGLGIAVLPDFVIPPGENVTALPVALEHEVEYGIIFRSRDKTDKVQKLVRIAKDYGKYGSAAHGSEPGRS